MIKAIKVVGLNSDTQAALAFSSRQEVGPNLFAVIACTSDDAFSRARTALTEAEDYFFGSSAKLGERLTSAFDVAKQSLQNTEEAEILLAAINDQSSEPIFYLMSNGHSLSAFLLRGSKETNLCVLAEAGELISGTLQPNDRVVITTHSLLAFLGGDLNRLTTLPIESVEEEIVGKLPEAQNCPLATVVIENEGEEIAEEEPEINPTLDTARIKPSLKIKLPIHLTLSKKIMAVAAAIFLLVIVSGVILGSRQKKQPDDAPQEIETRMEEPTPAVLNAFPVSDFSLWLDLDLVKKDFSTQKLSLSLGKLLVLDSDKGTLATVGISSKSHQLLAGQEKLGEATATALNGEVAWVFSEDKGVIRIEGAGGKPEIVAEIDEDWGSIDEIYGFAGNVYLLDKGKNQIWKYIPIASGFSDKKEYFKNEVQVDLSDAKRLQIDSSVWILKVNGGIFKYTQGSPDTFSITGLDKPVKEPKSLFVADTTDNVYLLDSGNGRLLVLDKQGAYQSQYTAEQFKEFTDLVVDEKNKKVYLLLGSKIFVMELK